MPNWNAVIDEIQNSERKDALDSVRVKYLKEFHDRTNRNVICYYSAFLQRPEAGRTEITDEDKNGFMTCIHGLDRSKGLDLILHTPGGQIAATESLVDYIRSMFGNDVRAFIPQIAMSAGTMISCSCKEVIMGLHSNLGPIDPQFGGIPAQGVIAEFQKAKEEIKLDPSSIPLWQTIIGKYHPTFIGECKHAIDLSEQLVTEWLKTGMFLGEPDSETISKRLVEELSSHDSTKMHSRHISRKDVIEYGMKILSLEDDFDKETRDTLLTIHHCFMHAFSQVPNASKIIENHVGRRMVMFSNSK